MAFALTLFVGGAAVIAYVGTRMTTLADRLADRTGLGEAFIGALFLGAATSLPGITASVTAAAAGQPQMALANAIGGIAAQTAFLAIADITYRKANLEHAATSVPNMLQASLLIVLLGLMVLTMAGPSFDIFGIHPLTMALPILYLFGLHMIRHAGTKPMWQPLMTEQTRPDEEDEPKTPAMADTWMWLKFVGAALLVIAAGYGVTRATIVLAEGWGFNQSVAGAIFTAIATSLPELVTSIAAVRRGALTLAVSGVIGGNCFDTLFAAVADAVYRPGSLYHAATAQTGNRELSLIAASITMTAVLLLGLLRREKYGPAGIGFESVAVLVIYLGVMVLLGVG